MTSSDETKSCKPEKFNGTYFKRWANQMRYWLTTLGLLSAIDSSKTPASSSSAPPAAGATAIVPVASTSSKAKTPEEIDYHCYHRILSCLSDKLYDLYYEYKNAKELWEALEAEYGFDDAGIERFNSSSFNKFKMVDSKPMNDQLHEFQDYVRHLQSKDNNFTEDFKVSNLIDKLPSSWSSFARDLRHQQGDLTLLQALKAIRIEDQHRLNSKPPNEFKAKVNLTENQGQNSNKNKKFFKPKGKKFKKSRGPFHSNKNFNKGNRNFNNNPSTGFCYVCGLTNHLGPQCFKRMTAPVGTPGQKQGNFSGPKVNMVEDNLDGFRSVNPSVNLAIRSDDWWFDSGANIHVSFERSSFSTYQESRGGSVALADVTTAQILGTGRVDLKLTSGKTLTLQNVLHVPSVRKNLISGSLLVQAGYKIVLEANKVVITKNDVFIGKGFIFDGLFKMNVIPKCLNNKSPSSTILNVESCDVWHGRLGHVNFGTLRRMINLNLIPKSKIEPSS